MFDHESRLRSLAAPVGCRRRTTRAVFALCFALGCSGVQRAARPSSTLSSTFDPRFVDDERHALTRVPAASRGESALRTLTQQPPFAEARRVARAWLRALRAGDAAALEALLATSVIDLAAGPSREPAHAVAERCLRDAGALPYALTAPATTADDGPSLRCDTLRRRDARARALPGLDPDDIVVTLEPGPGGGGMPPCARAVFVRLGPRPTVVAVLR